MTPTPERICELFLGRTRDGQIVATVEQWAFATQCADALRLRDAWEDQLDAETLRPTQTSVFVAAVRMRVDAARTMVKPTTRRSAPKE